MEIVAGIVFVLMMIIIVILFGRTTVLAGLIFEGVVKLIRKLF